MRKRRRKGSEDSFWWKASREDDGVLVYGTPVMKNAMSQTVSTPILHMDFEEAVGSASPDPASC